MVNAINRYVSEKCDFCLFAFFCCFNFKFLLLLFLLLWTMSSSPTSSSKVSPSGVPIIYYSVIAFNTKVICEVDEHRVVSPSPPKREKKYIRASKKILGKISSLEIRRPDGMGTLISGTYSYNYIHGFSYCNNTNYPLLESLIFLCVLPLYQQNPNVTSNEREIAFNFLSSVRRDFLTSFAEHLRYISNHPLIHNLAVKIKAASHSNSNGAHSADSTRSEQDENISVNLGKLSRIMVRRMHGRYDEEFEFVPIAETEDADDDDEDEEDEEEEDEEEEEEEEEDDEEEEDEEQQQHQEPTKSTNPFYGDKDGEAVPVKVTVNKMAMIKEEDSASQYALSLYIPRMNDVQCIPIRSRINAFVESINDVHHKMRRSLSVGACSVKSYGARSEMSEDKFVDFETMPLIGSIGAGTIGGLEALEAVQRSNGNFVMRHRLRLRLMI